MASAATGVSRDGLSIGRVFARAWRALVANPVAMLVIALLCGALPSNGLARLIQPLMRGMFFWGTGGMFLFLAVNIALGAFLGAMNQAAMTRAVAMNTDGGHVPLGAALWSGLPVIIPLVGLAVLIALGFTASLALLIVPGVFVLVICSVAASALVEEREGIADALYRSAYLTKGARLRVLGIDLVLLAIGMGATMSISALSVAVLNGWATASNFGVTGMTLLYLVPSLVVHTLLYAFVPAVKAALYLELRDWKDGPQTDTLAEVFA